MPFLFLPESTRVPRQGSSGLPHGEQRVTGAAEGLQRGCRGWGMGRTQVAKAASPVQLAVYYASLIFFFPLRLILPFWKTDMLLRRKPAPVPPRRAGTGGGKAGWPPERTRRGWGRQPTEREPAIPAPRLGRGTGGASR